MPNNDTFTIEIKRQYPYAAERVYAAWLDPALAGRFLFATPAGEMVRVALDPRVGGTFEFADRRDGIDVIHTGKYIALVPPTSILFEFSVDGSPSSRVQINITPGEAGCELTLTHTMSAEWADYRERVSHGWSTILEGLNAALDARGA